MKSITAAAVALAAAAAAADANPFPSIDIHGDTYDSGCVTRLWDRTQESLAEASKGRKSDALSKLVRTWLCESGAAADEIIRRQTNSKIAQTSEQTGILEKEKRQVSRLSVSTLGGKAWRVIVETLEGQVTVSYYPNEACAASGTFAYKKGKWLLISIDEACD